MTTRIEQIDHSGVKGLMKTVGRCVVAPSGSGLECADALLNEVNELRRGKPMFPRGVYRFKSFEEAGAWSLQMITRPTRDPEGEKPTER